MPVTIDWAWTTGTITDELNGDSAELSYYINGTDDLETAKDDFATLAPSTYDGMSLVGVSVDTRLGDTTWAGTASYSRVKPTTFKLVGESQFNFDISGQTVRTTQALEHIQSYAASGEGTPPDFKGGIGFNGERHEGTDIYVPVWSFSETHVYANASVTSGFKTNIFNTVAKTNSDVFRGRAAGEVLFIGATGSSRNEDEWEVTYRFLVSPNITGLTVSDITGIAKEGWEYLWFLYAPREDDTAKFITPRPIAAYVERVYEAANFGTNLGI